MKNWEQEIGEIVKQTYARAGYKDVTIILGATKGDTIHTQFWGPGNDLATDFDIRFLLFSMFNHVFSEWNDCLEEAEQKPWEE